MISVGDKLALLRATLPISLNESCLNNIASIASGNRKITLNDADLILKLLLQSIENISITYKERDLIIKEIKTFLSCHRIKLDTLQMYLPIKYRFSLDYLPGVSRLCSPSILEQMTENNLKDLYPNIRNGTLRSNNEDSNVSKRPSSNSYLNNNDNTSSSTTNIEILSPQPITDDATSTAGTSKILHHSHEQPPMQQLTSLIKNNQNDIDSNYIKSNKNTIYQFICTLRRVKTTLSTIYYLYINEIVDLSTESSSSTHLYSVKKLDIPLFTYGSKKTTNMNSITTFTSTITNSYSQYTSFPQYHIWSVSEDTKLWKDKNIIGKLLKTTQNNKYIGKICYNNNNNNNIKLNNSNSTFGAEKSSNFEEFTSLSSPTIPHWQSIHQGSYIGISIQNRDNSDKLIHLKAIALNFDHDSSVSSNSTNDDKNKNYNSVDVNYENNISTTNTAITNSHIKLDAEVACVNDINKFPIDILSSATATVGSEPFTAVLPETSHNVSNNMNSNAINIQQQYHDKNNNFNNINSSLVDYSYSYCVDENKLLQSLEELDKNRNVSEDVASYFYNPNVRRRNSSPQKVIVCPADPVTSLQVGTSVDSGSLTSSQSVSVSHQQLSHMKNVISSYNDLLDDTVRHQQSLPMINTRLDESYDTAAVVPLMAATADDINDIINNNTQISTSSTAMHHTAVAMSNSNTVTTLPSQPSLLQQTYYPTQGHVKFLRSSLPRKNTTGSGGHTHTLRFSNNFRVKEPSRKNLIVDQYLCTTTAQSTVTVTANKAVTPLTPGTSSISEKSNNFSSNNTGLAPLNPNQTVNGSSGKQTVLASMTISDSDPLSHSNLPPVFQMGKVTEDEFAVDFHSVTTFQAFCLCLAVFDQ